MRVPILLAALLLFMLACGDEDGVQEATGLSRIECLSRYEIISALTMPPLPTGGYHYEGSGVLEQLVLENESVVRARLLDVQLSAVDIDSIQFELKGRTRAYESYKYTLLNEVELQVDEYLKGEGPSTITAVVESETSFNSEEARDCAKQVFAEEFSQLFDSVEGIAVLEPTSDSNLYHLGVSRENFKGEYGHHNTWLPGKDGNFYNRSKGEWISLAEVRQRAFGVLEEYNRRDDEEWQSCVFSKYYDKGWDPWVYRGISMPFQYFRDHNIIFNSEDVPVPAGTMVWNWPDQEGDGSDTNVRLEGEHAHLFEVIYHSEYEYTANEWKGNYGGTGHHLAIWYKRKDGEVEQWQATSAGHVITVAEDLEDGVYRFAPRFEGGEFVDCGQEKFGPGQYTVIVDEDGPPSPPAPTKPRVGRWPEVELWSVVWDHGPGVDYHRVEVYRLNEGEREVDVALGGDAESNNHPIRSADMKGCDDVIYVEIRGKGDGGIYLDDFGEPSKPLKIEAQPCEPK